MPGRSIRERRERARSVLRELESARRPITGSLRKSDRRRPITGETHYAFSGVGCPHPTVRPNLAGRRLTLASAATVEGIGPSHGYRSMPFARTKPSRPGRLRQRRTYVVERSPTGMPARPIGSQARRTAGSSAGPRTGGKATAQRPVDDAHVHAPPRALPFRSVGVRPLESYPVAADLRLPCAF